MNINEYHSVAIDVIECQLQRLNSRFGLHIKNGDGRSECEAVSLV